MKTSIVTFPIGVRSAEPKNGLLAGPIVAQMLANRMSADCVVAINTIDSWIQNRESFLPPFQKALHDTSIISDTWVDKDNKNELINCISNLIDKNIITEEEREINSCSCGKVECLTTTPVHPKARLYTIGEKENDITCKSCDSIATTTQQQVLVYRPNVTMEDQPESFPKIAKPRVKDIWSRIHGMEYLISRSRDTGLHLKTQDHQYSLDVDSVWLQYLNTIEADKLVLVGSNHVAWQLCLASSYLKAANDQRDVDIVLTPYVRGQEPKEALELQGQRKMLWFMLNMRWGQLETKWEPSFIQKLKNASDENINEIVSGKNMCASTKDAIFSLNPNTLVQQIGKKELS
jgi:hypothetical protein